MLAERRATVGGAVLASVANAYDALGNRIRRVALGSGGASVSDVRFGLDGWDPSKPRGVGTENFDAVVDRDASGGVLVRRMFGSGFDAVLSRADAAGVRWYGTDRLPTKARIGHASRRGAFGHVRYDGGITNGQATRQRRSELVIGRMSATVSHGQPLPTGSMRHYPASYHPALYTFNTSSP